MPQQEQRKLVNLSYEEAIFEKNRYPSDIVKQDGIDHVLIIAPNSKSDFKKFYTFFNLNSSSYNDELCKEYSSDNKYQVRAHLLSAIK